MINKTYKTRELKGYSLHLIIDGVKTYISFRRGCTLGSTATYSTSDTKIQNALESLKTFGEVFYVSNVTVTGEDNAVADKKEEAPVPEIADTPVEEKEVVDILDAQTFRNLVELRNALEAKGVDVSGITNVKAGENLAKKHGYNYTVEKNS